MKSDHFRAPAKMVKKPNKSTQNPHFGRICSVFWLVCRNLLTALTMGAYFESMSTDFIQAKVLDAKTDTRRSRHILAASGQVLESGEVRDLNRLFVMGRDGKLIKVSDLNANPKKQTEDYSVQAQADHGEIVDGELVPTVEKQFGSCKVWLAEDGLHAQMYFADDDALADHAWKISQDASYSVGIDWFPDGYYGADNAIAEPVGILREISMVLTGNDPRAKTIDGKTSNQEAQRGEEKVADKLTEKENKMDKTKDNLTPDEAKAFAEELGAVIDKFTTSAPEDETEPTARDDAPEGEEKTEDVPSEASKDTKTLHQPVLVVRDRVVSQETPAVKIKTADFKKSEAFNKIVRDSLRQNGMSMNNLDTVLRQNFAKASKDGITGVPNITPAEEIFVRAFEGADGILSHVRNLNVKSFRAHFMSLGSGEEGRAHGHKAGDKKADQSLADSYRDILVKMIYKKNPLDATMLYENPQLLNFTDEELDDLIVKEIERAIVIGDGREAPTGSAADYRVFDGTRGFYSIKADAAATSGAGTLAASTITLASGDNLYDGVIKARGAIKASGNLIVIAKSSSVTDLLTAKTSGNGYLVQPGVSPTQFLNVKAVYTPEWMDDETNVAYVFAENQYGLIGDAGISHRNSFDADYNTEVRLAEIPRGGSLIASKAAVAIAPAS